MKRKAAAVFRFPEYFSFRERMKFYRRWIFHINFLKKKSMETVRTEKELKAVNSMIEAVNDLSHEEIIETIASFVRMTVLRFHVHGEKEKIENLRQRIISKF